MIVIFEIGKLEHEKSTKDYFGGELKDFHTAYKEFN